MAYRATQLTECRRTRIRQSILDECTRLISFGGFQAVSMSEIAANAGIATGSIYRHFPSKSDLCTEVFRVQTGIEAVVMQAAVDKQEDVTKKIIDGVGIFSRRALKAPTLAWTLMAEALDPKLEAERLYLRKTYVEIFENIIMEGMERGVFIKQDAAISASALTGAMAQTLIISLSPANDEKLSNIEKENLIKNIIQFCLRALGSDRVL